jgi:hypothetical protein
MARPLESGGGHLPWLALPDGRLVGTELIMLYNDAWQPILGDTKHPAGLGRPGRDS